MEEESCKHRSHRPSPETPPQWLSSPPDGLILRRLDYVWLSGDPAQVGDLEKTVISKCACQVTPPLEFH